MSSELTPWILFNVFIALMLGVDLFLHKDAKKVSMKEAGLWSLFWIALALLFNLYIYYTKGQAQALDFLTGYLIEKSLSIDNLFIFLLIFNYFKTPDYALHKVLFWGIFGAILMRALFIWLGITLISNFHWMLYLFGIFLILTGIKFWFEKGKEFHPENNPLLKLFKRFFPTTKDYTGTNFFVQKGGKWFATPLFLVLLLIETTDLIFALDSIPAILAITYDPFIVYTSNIFAILGLRSLYFLLQPFMGLFDYLHYGLSLILIFVGLKMVTSGYIHIPITVSLAVILTLLCSSILFSIYKKKIDEKR